MRACKNCRFGERMLDQGRPFVMCRALPGYPLLGGDGSVQWVQPPKVLTAWCGGHRFSLWKTIRELIRGNGA